MKTISKMMVLAVAAAVSASAATMTSSVQTQPSPTGELNRQERKQAADEVVQPVQTSDGIAMQALKSPQPLQVINPLAPASYGNGEQNIVRDPIDNHVVGLKVLSLDF